MKDMVLYFQYVLRRFGKLNVLVGILLITSIVIVSAFTVPERHRLHIAQLQTKKLQHHIIKREVADISDMPNIMVNTFYSMLPSEATLNDQLEKFFDAAFDNNIYLDSIEYTLTADKATNFTRYHITLPISGHYTNIRKFVKQLLAQVPNASLDNISFARENVGDIDVDAKLQITLYLKPAIR